MKCFCKYESPIGPLYLGEEDGFLSLLVFSHEDPRLQGYTLGETSVLKQAISELSGYFSGTRQRFEVPLRVQGTDFQKRVWDRLRNIPYGEICSYKEIAVLLQSPKASRAVGLANKRNPISIIIPCHRVVGHSGKLVGYAGGLTAKEFLLELEQQYV